jgi:hypothetical protein
MANQLSKSGIVTTNAVEAWHVTQSIDAFTGISAYDITLSGSLNLTGSVIEFPTFGTITATGNISSSGGNLFGKQATLSGRLNTNVIRGQTSSDTTVSIEDNLNVIGNITASGYINAKRNIQSLDNTESLTIAMSASNGYGSGTIISLDLSTGSSNIEFKLPTTAGHYTGYEYDFIINATAGSGTVFKVTAVTSETLNGIAICDDGTKDIQGTLMNFNATKAIRGTRLKCISDGVGWHITAFCLCDLSDIVIG